jgi:hypothetical protein
VQSIQPRLTPAGQKLTDKCLTWCTKQVLGEEMLTMTGASDGGLLGGLAPGLTHEGVTRQWVKKEYMRVMGGIAV